MKKIILSSLLVVNSFLFAASTDLACQEVPVSIYYAGFKDAADSQKYVYFNGSAVLEITPPAAYGEKKTIKVISSEFSSVPSISTDGSNIQFSSANGSEEASNKLASLANVPISIYYAGFKDAAGEQKYVYFNGSAVLEITPPAAYGESKSISVITSEFDTVPTLSSNGVNIVFGALSGSSCGTIENPPTIPPLDDNTTSDALATPPDVPGV